MDNLDVDLLSFLFSLVVGIITATWTIANIKYTHDAKFSAMQTDFNLKLSEVKHQQEKLDLQNKNDHDNLEYLYNFLKESINHKTKRLERQTTDINKYLEKDGTFKARNGFNSSEDET